MHAHTGFKGSPQFSVSVVGFNPENPQISLWVVATRSLALMGCDFWTMRWVLGIFVGSFWRFCLGGNKNMNFCGFSFDPPKKRQQKLQQMYLINQSGWWVFFFQRKTSATKKDRVDELILPASKAQSWRPGNLQAAWPPGIGKPLGHC